VAVGLTGREAWPSGTAGMLVSGELLSNRVEVSRYIEAEVEK
jgi:hypothetical protein